MKNGYHTHLNYYNFFTWRVSVNQGCRASKQRLQRCCCDLKKSLHAFFKMLMRVKSVIV